MQCKAQNFSSLEHSENQQPTRSYIYSILQVIGGLNNNSICLLPPSHCNVKWKIYQFRIYQYLLASQSVSFNHHPHPLSHQSHWKSIDESTETDASYEVRSIRWRNGIRNKKNIWWFSIKNNCVVGIGNILLSNITMISWLSILPCCMI